MYLIVFVNTFQIQTKINIKYMLFVIFNLNTNTKKFCMKIQIRICQFEPNPGFNDIVIDSFVLRDTNR